MNVWTFYLATSRIAVFSNSLYCMYGVLLTLPNEVLLRNKSSV